MVAQRISIKCDNLRTLGYNNAKEWTELKNSVYTGRFVKIIIKNKLDKQVYVLPNSKWSNPYKVSKDMPVELSLELYKKHIQTSGLYKDIKELVGKQLGCFCLPDAPCHAQLLANLANEYEQGIVDEKNIIKESTLKLNICPKLSSPSSDNLNTKIKKSDTKLNHTTTHDHHNKTFIFTHIYPNGTKMNIKIDGIHHTIMNNLYTIYPTSDIYLIKKYALIIIKALTNKMYYRIYQTNENILKINTAEQGVYLKRIICETHNNLNNSKHNFSLHPISYDESYNGEQILFIH